MFVSIVVVRGIYAELQKRGADAESWLRESGVDHGMLSDLRATVSLDKWDALLARAMNLLDDPGLGLSIGFSESESMLQLLGYLLMSSRTLHEAVQLCQRYSGLVVDSMRVELVDVGRISQFRYAFHGATSAASLRFAEDLVSALAVRIGEHHVGPGYLREIHFRQPEPAYLRRFERFGCPVRFGQEQSEIVFDRNVLFVAQPHGDAQVVESLSGVAERMLKEISGTPALSQRVRALLEHEPELHCVDADRIAAKMGMHYRTLRRRLRAEGTSIRELIDETRMRQACANLLHPSSTIKDTAERLGYSEPSAFHRAFKRWTGRTPAEYARGDVVSNDGMEMTTRH